MLYIFNREFGRSVESPKGATVGKNKNKGRHDKDAWLRKLCVSAYTLPETKHDDPPEPAAAGTASAAAERKEPRVTLYSLPETEPDDPPEPTAAGSASVAAERKEP